MNNNAYLYPTVLQLMPAHLQMFRFLQPSELLPVPVTLPAPMLPSFTAPEVGKEGEGGFKSFESFVSFNAEGNLNADSFCFSLKEKSCSQHKQSPRLKEPSGEYE